MFLTTALKAFCESCDSSFFGSAIRNSVWLFPFVEIFHLFALGVLGGTVLAINLRALGFRFRGDSLQALSRELQPWMLGSLAAMLVSGFLLFSSEAVKMYYNPAFRLKMTFLIIALVFSFTFHRKVTMSGASSQSSSWQKLAAVLSLILWSGVGLSGRAIGYVRQVHSGASREFQGIPLAESESNHKPSPRVTILLADVEFLQASGLRTR